MATLRTLLDLPELGLTALVLPDPATEYRWVATSELVDPTPFLEGGEVLLTTGLGTAAWHGEWGPYVDRLAAAGVVALGLAVGLTHTVVPAALVEACSDTGLALLEVPPETTFVAISQTAVRQLQAEEESVVRVTLDAQRRLTRAALDTENGTRAVLRGLAALGATTCLVAPDGSVVEGPHGPAPEVLAPETVRAVVGDMLADGLHAAASVGTGNTSVVAHPLGVRGTPRRYLLASFPGRATEVHRSSVTTAVTLLSLSEERARAALETDRRLRSRAVEVLLSGDEATCRLLLGLPDGLRPRLPARLCVLLATGDPAVEEAGMNLAESHGLAAGRVDDALVVLSPARRAATIAGELAERGLRVGVGEEGPPGSALHGHRTARGALALTSAGYPIATWTDRTGRGVLGVLEPDRAAAFGSTYLAGLHADPEAEALVATLRSFLRHHGSQLKVAGELGLHRNTVRRRLTRIEELLGRSLADPQTRVDAWVALQADPDR